jgi:hypothetical protein
VVFIAFFTEKSYKNLQVQQAPSTPALPLVREGPLTRQKINIIKIIIGDFSNIAYEL